MLRFDAPSPWGRGLGVGAGRGGWGAGLRFVPPKAETAWQELLLPQENNKHADIRRGDAADAAGLADAGRADALELFDGLQP